MSYDPDLRRDTPLAIKIKERIRASGPMLLSAYMNTCLNDPEHGYYRTQKAIGAGADFVTAPEISQAFGELVGLWSAAVWQDLGKPRPLELVEFGPGRGTMMRDALRASRIVPGFHDALYVALVEVNRQLALQQAKTLAGCGVPIGHYDDVHTIFGMQQPGFGREVPRLFLANEILDVLPIRQLQFKAGAWRHRKVGLDDRGELCFVIAQLSQIGIPISIPPPVEGDIFEVCFDHHFFLNSQVGQRANRQSLAALFIDYGHDEPGYGDTLQAVRGHKYESVFASPGEADLTAQVDFASVAHEARRLGFVVDGPTTQAEFLGRLGIIERASKLMGANPGKAGEIEAGVMRLMAPNGMGTRFKAIGIRSPTMGKLPGFE
ncbi:MAG: SAM-dependent methyltransferase [Hyphomicrobiaceae bacterium]